MTWRWLTCFSISIALSAGATVAGRIQLRDSKDAQVRKKDYSGVVVSLIPVGHQIAPTPQHAKIIQQNKTFTPHLLAVPVGSTVDFPNFDPIFHNAFSNYSGQIFDIGLYPPGTSRSVKFTREGVVRIFCNIHSSMSAVVIVLGTPYFATSARDGTYSISGVESGEYTVRFFHERATQAELDRVARRITVGDEPLDLASVSISESGYLAIPHTNKYGREYGPEPDDRAYPGARK